MGFGNDLAYAGASLDDLMQQRYMERLAAEKQAESIRQFNVGAGERAREHDLNAKMHADQLAQNAQSRQDALAAGEQSRQDTRTQRFAEGPTPPMDISGSPMVGRLNAGGYGGYIQSAPAGPDVPVRQGIANLANPTEGTTGLPAEQMPIKQQFTGGAIYTGARVAAGERAAQAEQAAQEAAARNRENIASRELMASEGDKTRAAIAAGNLGVAQGGLDLRRQIETDKKTAAAQDEARKGVNAADQANTVIGLTNDLEKHPGFPSLFGVSGMIPNLPGSATSNAKARLEQLKGLLSLEKLQEMRRETRSGTTGFGRLTQSEFGVIANAAGRLQQSQSEPEARTALKEIRDHLQKVASGSGAATPGPANDPLGIR